MIHDLLDNNSIVVTTAVAVAVLIETDFMRERFRYKNTKRTLHRLNNILVRN